MIQCFELEIFVSVGAYVWAWLFLAYVKFVMCVRDMWVVQWYCVFEGLVEM